MENPEEGRANDAPGTEVLLRSLHAFKVNSDMIEQLLVRKLQQSNGRSLSASLMASVSTIVQDASRLALRMGAQRAHVMLQKPAHGDLITLDDYYRHNSGTLGPGTRVQVELVLEPCMVRIGDGRDDLTSIKIIHKGSVFAFAE